MSTNTTYPSCAVIVTTYNSPHLLRNVLCGYELQSHTDFDIYVADDGSGPETAALLEQFRKRGKLRIHHVWHPDNGFRKTAILNKAIAECTADYLVFTDGDCIPQATFVEGHLRAAQQGKFVAATLFRMAPTPTQAVTPENIASGDVFSVRWLRANDQPWSYKLLRLYSGSQLASLLNRVTPTLLYWAGCNASAWRTDIVAVNGFDERMEYGGLDKEFGERLINAGIRPTSCRYTLLCMHQDHGREYANQAARDRNLEIRRQVKLANSTWTKYGLIKSDSMPSDSRKAA